MLDNQGKKKGRERKSVSLFHQFFWGAGRAEERKERGGEGKKGKGKKNVCG